MYVVRFKHLPSGVYRVSRSPFRIRKWRTEAEAQAFADKINGTRNVANAHVVELNEPERRTWVAPKGVLTRAKWTLQRSRIRLFMARRGMVLTSGDRTYNSLASQGRVSDHWVEVTSSWADDYWHPDKWRMRKAADELRRAQNLKQILVHDAGTGDHIHVAGYT